MRFIAWLLSKIFGSDDPHGGPVTKRDSTEEVKKFEEERKP
jgi:hypothetical protein